MDLLKVNNMERIYLITAFTFICSTIYLSISNYLLKSQYKYLRNDFKVLERELDQKQKRLRNYSLTAIELNNICDQFQSSRKEKAKNKKLQELLNELN